MRLFSRKKNRGFEYDENAGRDVEIGAPTGFQRGIHVEVDLENGTLKGVPTQWKDTIANAQFADTADIDPSLVPEVPNKKGWYLY